GQGRVAHGEFIEVDMPACLLHQFRETVEVATGAMVVDGNNRVMVRLHERTDGVGSALLHFGVCPLDGIQFNTRTISPGIGRRYRGTAHADAVIFAAEYHETVAIFWCMLFGLFRLAITHAAGHHDDLVIA